MPEPILPNWRSIHTIVFDFDGVFTNNMVWIDQNGKESVRCDRGDGLAFDLLRRFIKVNEWNLNYFILSKEKNPVVSARADKICIPCIQGNSNKADYLNAYLEENRLDSEGLLYVGNDLNDLAAMKLAGFSIAPSDAHPLIRHHANMVLSHKGGEGFVRELIEKLLHIDQLTLDQLIQLL